MWPSSERQKISALVSIAAPLLAAVSSVSAQGDPFSPPTSHDASKPELTSSTAQPTCASITVNYITHTLPQQCLTTSPTTTPAVETISVSAGQTPDVSASSNQSTGDAGSGEQTDGGDSEEDVEAEAFPSFEEWKKMMLEKSGQEPLEARHRRSHEAYPGGDFDTLGEEGEISLDFDAYSDRISEITSPTKSAPQSKEKDDKVEKVTYEGLAHVYRSKDAGKTCKERFSYSSFDAGATVLKTSRGAKNPKAILVENKDSYMLLECAQENKFFIVELSDDILVDTVVLANFEFFSSMIRQFRVSVSDRYPVKMDKWKVLGTYQARNSRDIQPFLIENPQIWARYLRIEILSHYGNEYYCPLSLLRVHGTRMLDSWKDADPNEIEIEAEAVAEEIRSASLSEHPEETIEVEEPMEEVEMYEPAATTIDNVTNASETSKLMPFWDASYFVCHFGAESTCGLAEPQAVEQEDVRDAPAGPEPGETVQGTSPGYSYQQAPQTSVDSSSVTSAGSSQTSSVRAPNSTDASQLSDSHPTRPPPTHHISSRDSIKTAASTSLKPPSSSKAPISKPASAPTSTRNNRTTGGGSTTSSSTIASPTVQDSFFKQLQKRLQTLESNTTLSLQYIESQSRFLQDALQKLERRQVSKVDAFLDGLNKTVLSELRDVRMQYDQVWQSTVIALESQREQAEREIVALSSRLGVLADEVVFQKRMAIVQSVLLLGCLALVIFSRGLATAGMDLYYPGQIINASSRLASPVRSPTVFPSSPKVVAVGLGRRTPPGGRRRGSDDGSNNTNTTKSNRGGMGTRTHSHSHSHSQRGSSASVSSTAVGGEKGGNPTPEITPRSQSTAAAASGSHIYTEDAHHVRHRPSAGPRSMSEAEGLEYYEPPTPTSIEEAEGYDSEPASTTTPPGQGRDYASPHKSADDLSIGRDVELPPDFAVSEVLTPQQALERGLTLTPEDEVEDEDAVVDGRELEYSVHHAVRPSLSHLGSSRKPLPALPEDPD